MNCIARYVVTETKSGKVIAHGSSVDCAEVMGITYGSFLAMATRSRKGIGKRYTIERVDDEPWQKECARKWDEAFGWFLSMKKQYPCEGCMRRASCDFSGTYCKKWETWFRDAYDAAVAVLKARGGAG